MFKNYLQFIEKNCILKNYSVWNTIWFEVKIHYYHTPNHNPIQSVCGLIVWLCFTEIYRIVSQKQIRDPPEGDTIRPTNVEAIDVKPTVNTDSVRRQCCQWARGSVSVSLYV